MTFLSRRALGLPPRSRGLPAFRNPALCIYQASASHFDGERLMVESPRGVARSTPGGSFCERRQHDHALR